MDLTPKRPKYGEAVTSRHLCTENQAFVPKLTPRPRRPVRVIDVWPCRVRMNHLGLRGHVVSIRGDFDI